MFESRRASTGELKNKAEAAIDARRARRGRERLLEIQNCLS
jgi:hypothetical protein